MAHDDGARTALPTLRPSPRSDRGAGRVPAPATSARRDQGGRRRAASSEKGRAADEQADLRKCLQEPAPRALGRTNARGLRAQGSSDRRRADLTETCELHRERRWSVLGGRDRADGRGSAARPGRVRRRAPARSRIPRRTSAAAPLQVGPAHDAAKKRGVDVLGLVPSGRSLLLALAGVSIAVGLYGLARETSLFAVRSVEVEGASAPVAAYVRAALRSYEGRSLVAVDAGAVEQRADALPAVRSAVVDRAFPHTIRIRIAPEMPVAVLRRGSESWLVSARGRVIQTIERGSRPKLPRIWLPSVTELQAGAFLADAPGALAARSLAALVGSGFPDRISFVRALNGQITLGLRGGLEIDARGVLPLLALPGKGGPDYLDLTVPERPVAGRNPQPSGLA
ncbi:MAG: FtsQ-type POTRA domain-containing protein [Actinobacteria bacterium]|nr:MAG: FtsQ-type POTRA domain-containing protein [Actinomycetota bacterium]